MAMPSDRIGRAARHQKGSGLPQPCASFVVGRPSWLISAVAVAGTGPMIEVGDAGGVVGAAANLLAVSAGPGRSTKQIAMATTTSRLRATHTPVSSQSPESLRFQEATQLHPAGQPWISFRQDFEHREGCAGNRRS